MCTALYDDERTISTLHDLIAALGAADGIVLHHAYPSDFLERLAGGNSCLCPVEIEKTFLNYGYRPVSDGIDYRIEPLTTQ